MSEKIKKIDKISKEHAGLISNLKELEGKRVEIQKNLSMVTELIIKHSGAIEVLEKLMEDNKES